MPLSRAIAEIISIITKYYIFFALLFMQPRGFPKQKLTPCQQRNKVLPVALTRDHLSAILR